MKNLSLDKVRALFTPKRFLIALLIVLLAAGGMLAYHWADQYVDNLHAELQDLKNSKIELSEQLEHLRTDLASANRQIADNKTAYDVSLKTQQDKISALEAKTADLEKKINNRLPAKVPAPVPTKSVYDRIVSDNTEAKNKIIEAIKLIETNAPSYFAILKNQVTEIKLVTDIGCGGGVQQKRTISISYLSSDCLSATPTSTFASVIVHETYHVYNVYVNKVTVSGKEQELPSLYAQRDTFDALGIVQSFRDYINGLIAYYEAS